MQLDKTYEKWTLGAFDAARWVGVKADELGEVEIDRVGCIAGPAWQSWDLLAGMRRDSVEIIDGRRRRVAALPRAWEPPYPLAAHWPRAWWRRGHRAPSRGRSWPIGRRGGTPKQVEYPAQYLEAEKASRDASKRAPPMRQCAVPAPKTFDGYDRTAVSWPDGFFGRLKNEFFYHRDWQGVSVEEFMGMLGAYIEYYNEERVKEGLGWMSPNQYRRSLGLAA